MAGLMAAPTPQAMMRRTIMAGGGSKGTADWYRIMQMLPRPGANRKQAPSQRAKRLGQNMDVGRTRIQGLFGMMGIGPWGR